MNHRLQLPTGIPDDEVAILLSNLDPDPDLDTAGDVLRLAEDATLERESEGGWVLRTPPQRESEPPGHGLTVLARSFPDGVPFGDERDRLELLIALARRLGGHVTTDDGHVITPHPHDVATITLVTPYWLQPEDLEALVRGLVPEARLDIPELPAEPSRQVEPASRTDPALQAEPLAPADLARSESGPGPRGAETPGADVPVPAPASRSVPEGPTPEGPTIVLNVVDRPGAIDLLPGADDDSTPAPPDDDALRGYRIAASVFPAGDLEVLVTGDEPLPPALRAAEWTRHGHVTYIVQYLPADPAQIGLETPDDALAFVRAEVYGATAGVAVALHRYLHGALFDAAGFLLDPADLERD